MYMGALVRYYFTIGPRAKSQSRWWPDLSFEYLLAFRSAKVGVRAIPLGVAPFHIMDDPEWRHWRTVQDSFSATLADRYVNVICCPAGLLMGRAVTPAQLAPAVIDGVPPAVTAIGGKAANDWSVEPMPTLVGAFTVGLRNIAITGCNPNEPTSAEIAALNRYDAVVAPTIGEAARLRELGAKAQGYSPDALEADALALGTLLKGTGDE
jgi:hypothetical protein